MIRALYSAPPQSYTRLKNYNCLPFKSKRYEMTNHAHVTSICHHHRQAFCTMDVTASAAGVCFPASIKASPNTLHVITFPHLPIKPLYSNTRTLSGDLWEWSVSFTYEESERDHSGRQNCEIFSEEKRSCSWCDYADLPGMNGVNYRGWPVTLCQEQDEYNKIADKTRHVLSAGLFHLSCRNTHADKQRTHIL